MTKIREIIEKYAVHKRKGVDRDGGISIEMIEKAIIPKENFDKLEKDLDDYVGIVLETVYDRIRKVGVEKMNEIWNKKWQK